MEKLKKIFKVVEIKQVKRQSKFDVKAIKSPDDAADVLRVFIGESDREKFVALMLNTKNEVIGVDIISVGTVNSSIVHPREVFKSAILNNATSIIVGHNHPSGSIVPSQEDIDVTERLKQAGELIGIEVLDHVIVADYKHLSFKEKGYL